MRHEPQKIGKIVDEILTYFLHNYRAEMTIRVTPEADRYEMHFRFDNVAISDEEFEKLDKLLVVKRQPELEDYYWQLAGEIEVGNELMLIGMMCDELRLSRHGAGITLDLVRKV